MKIIDWVVNKAAAIKSFVVRRIRKRALKSDTEAILKRSKKIAEQFYSLKEDEEINEITTDILNSSDTETFLKDIIVSTGRRFFVFKYPSDEFFVKGVISFLPEASRNPLLLFLRGGNRIFGLMHPASDITCVRNYTVLATLYRGGVSEGVDEFGGQEVSDVSHLMDYFPKLQDKLGITLCPKQIFMLGSSRGGMQMFLTLARYPQVASLIDKAASLSGLVDMKEFLAHREDMKEMFVEDFGLVLQKNEEEWIKQRDVLDVVSKVRKDLPVLIVQGADDLRVGLKEGKHVLEKLRENGNPVSYLEIEAGDHCLSSQPNRMELIADWFES